MTTLTPQQLEQLAQLKDIQLPDAVSWWPPAMGWWLLMALFLLVVSILIYFVISHFVMRRLRLRKAALAELAALNDDDPIAFVADLSALLRRIALQRGEAVATLSGTAWAQYLSKDEIISQDDARHFADAPYVNPNTKPSTQTLRQAAEQWIRRNS